MYSKCCVEPLMRTPTAIAAAKGPLSGEEEEEAAAGAEVVGESRREEAPIRSEALAEAWICEAAMSLRAVSMVSRRRSTEEQKRGR